MYGILYFHRADNVLFNKYCGLLQDRGIMKYVIIKIFIFKIKAFKLNKRCIIPLLLFTSHLVRAADALDIEINKEIRNIIINDSRKECAYAKSKQASIEKQKFLCISLGFNCFPALNLERIGLRQQAFPFDWNITSLRGLCNILENNFLDFLNPCYLNQKPASEKLPAVPGIFNSKYNVALAHDFPEGPAENITANWQDYLPEISEKYERRIQRFYSVCDLADTVYFFRLKSTYWIFDDQPEDKASLIRLRDILRQKFPTNNWVLVVIDNSKKYKKDWGIPQIRNFYMCDTNKVEHWMHILKKLGLIK